MIVNTLKGFVSGILKYFGYGIHKRPTKADKLKESQVERKLTQEFDFTPSTVNRPIGDFNTFIRDIEARGFRSKRVLDIGANKTDWSRMVKKIFPDADFYLIDPLIEMKEYMEEFCNEFEGSEYFIVGVGSKKEKLTLSIFGEFLEGSTLMIEDIPSMKRANRQREIEIETIDSVFKKNNLEIPDLVKIDVQGFELEALKGAEKLFGKTEMFILEVSLFKFNKTMPEFTEIVNFMNDRDYVIYDIPGYLRRPYDGALAQLDICFVKRDSFLRNTIRWDKK